MMVKNFIKKIAFVALGIGLAISLPAAASRTDNVWFTPDNLHLETSLPTGFNLLINGVSRYLNFGSTSGTSGYGFRDNAGTIETKNSGGSWASIGSSGASTPQTLTNKIISGLTNTITNIKTWHSTIQGWIYPGEATCHADEEYSDGRQIHTLKPEYYTLNNDGTVSQVTTGGSGCNGYSAANALDVIAHSSEQFYTVSGNATGFAALMGSASLQASFVTTISDFTTTINFTGVELDIEGYGTWSGPNTGKYYAFLNTLAQNLHGQGKKLMVDIPPIWNSASNVGSGTGDEWDSANSTGYYALDYTSLNATAVDYFTILAYDYQYDYGNGASIQPLKWVSDIVHWAKSKIPDHNRIVIGMPSYGYYGTTAGFSPTLATYGVMAVQTGFATATRDATSGEMKWTNGGNSYVYNDSTSMDTKRAYFETLGINRVSVWHLGDNPWFGYTNTELGNQSAPVTPQAVQLPSMTFATDYPASGKFVNTTVSTGSATYTAAGLTLTTGASATSSQRNLYTFMDDNTTYTIFAGNPKFSTAIYLNSAGTLTGSWYGGLGNITVGGTGHTFTGNHIGFKLTTSGGVTTLSCTVADGTETATALTTAVQDDVFLLQAIVTSPGNVACYWNKNFTGWSAATNIATHIPTASASPYIQQSVSNNSTANAFIVITTQSQVTY